MSFKISHYIKTIKKYKKNGYTFKSVNESLTENKKNIYMVHDIDHNIDLCENFINAEKQCGITSSYFIRMHSKNYNIFSQKSIDILKKIKENNFTIGLHYEPVYSKVNQYEKDILRNINFLNETLDVNIKTFNIHEPARTNIDLSNIMNEKNRCYNSSFFKNVKYLSDSGGRWREGCFSKSVGVYKNLLVLTHPIWWYNERPSENY